MSSWWKSTAVVLKSRRLFMAKNSQYELLWCLWESLLQTTVVENFFSLSHLPLTKLLKRPKCSILAISCHFPFFAARFSPWIGLTAICQEYNYYRKLINRVFFHRILICRFFPHKIIFIQRFFPHRGFTHKYNNYTEFLSTLPLSSI